MSDYVWYSDMELIGEIFRDYVSTATEGLQAQQDVAAKLNWQGDVVPEAFIPKVFRPENSRPGELGELNLFPGRFLLIGKKTAEIISKFDLGHGAMHPVSIEDRAGNLMSKSEFFFWNFGNKNAYFLPEDSARVSKSNYGTEKPGEHIYFTPVIVKDDELSFSRECLSGPDVWCEKYLNNGTILSDRLAGALKDAGLGPAFELVRCRVS
jgi:hypothetical protein